MHCPRCNSLQDFPEKQRELNDGVLQLYIECKKCHWLKVTIEGNSSIIKERLEIKKLKNRVKKVPGLQRVIETKRKKIARKESNKETK